MSAGVHTWLLAENPELADSASLAKRALQEDSK